MSKLFNSNKLYMFIGLTLFVLITFPLMITHSTGFDEAHAWMNSYFMNLSNFVDIIKSEGHPIGWFLLIMPFAKNHIAYPYPMYIINYIFCILSLVVLWLKAPFSNPLKLIITCSSIFTAFYGIIARDYTIGIFGLFLCASLYENQLKKPILYSAVMALTMHTHIICTICVSGFMLIYLYKLFIEKEIFVEQKNRCLSVLILLSSMFFLLVSFIGGFSNSQNLYYAPPSLIPVSSFFIYNYHGAFLICYIFIVSAILISTKDIFTRLYYFYTTFLMLILFGCFYSGTAHHYFMFFINLIITMWIAFKNKNVQKVVNDIKFVILFVILFILPIDSNISYLYPQFSIKPFIDKVNSIDEMKGKKVYLDIFIRPFVPYLSKDFTLYDMCTYDEWNWKIYTAPCKKDLYDFKREVITNTDNDIYLLYMKSNKKDPVKYFDYPILFEYGNYYVFKINKNIR